MKSTNASTVVLFLVHSKHLILISDNIKVSLSYVKTVAKTFKSQCSFDNYVQCHVLGFHKCHICNQEFDLKSTLYKHMKKHDRRYFTCTVSASCPHRTCSLAMHTEHIKFSHLTKKQFKCKYCGMYFQTPTERCSHHWKVHGHVDEL